MDGLRRSIERGAVMSVERNGNNWQKPAIGALWALVLLFVGWLWMANDRQMVSAADKQSELAKSVQALSERVATQEEATRNIRESLQRIESGINALNEQQRRGQR